MPIKVQNDGKITSLRVITRKQIRILIIFIRRISCDLTHPKNSKACQKTRRGNSLLPAANVFLAQPHFSNAFLIHFGQLPSNCSKMEDALELLRKWVIDDGQCVTKMTLLYRTSLNVRQIER
jgi:hypothetical protein